ncbi:MAG: Hpt domain-containing protein [Sphingobacteriales bacterium]|nr:MAG: Hpt domain-containing protein [Sphingobacteriales bacterium]TAF82091.1 MAG: Hpt domain-containing protein [Sphingobacteriales bacterium]
MNDNLLPEFNLEYLATIADGDKEFMDEMIDMFLSQTPPQITSIQKAIVEKNYQHISQIAHKIKPTFTMFGLHSIKDSFTKIENYAQSGTQIKEIEKKLLSILPVLDFLYTRLRYEKDTF